MKKYTYVLILLLSLISVSSAFASKMKFEIKGYIRDITSMELNHNKFPISECKQFMRHDGFAECEGVVDFFVFSENYIYFVLPNPVPANFSISLKLTRLYDGKERSFLFPLSPGLRPFKKVFSVNNIFFDDNKSINNIDSITSGLFSGKKYSFCKDQELTRNGNGLVCKGAENFLQVINAKSKVQSEILFETIGVTDAQDLSFELLPDADTNSIYRFENALLNSQGKRVGYLVVAGYENSQTEIKIQITTKYNSFGELVSATIK